MTVDGLSGRDALRRVVIAAAALGVAAGGFFDGILLHQVLQWHHLFSGLDGGSFGDLRVQVLADGLFHALMYAIGVLGLVLLWRARGALGAHGAGRAVISGAAIGFGAWHVADGVLSHWLLGIHRIRMDSDVPLLWDLLWFVVFGIVPLLAGWLSRPRGNGGTSGKGGASAAEGRAAAAGLGLVVALAGPVAALPPAGAAGGREAIVVFRPGMSPAAMFSAVDAVGGRLVRTDSAGGVWVLDFDDPDAALGLYGRGAWLVSRSAVAAGCLGWTRGA